MPEERRRTGLKMETPTIVYVRLLKVLQIFKAGGAFDPDINSRGNETKALSNNPDAQVNKRYKNVFSIKHKTASD